MRKNCSELIKWSSTFECGLKLIDDQHKALVALVNDMFNHVTGKEADERAYFKKIILEVTTYVKVHFATEEKILTATKFHGYAEHKREHDNFIYTVTKNIKDFESGKRLSFKNFTKFLKDWVLSHIAVMDKQYFEYFRKIATRKDDGKLSIDSNDVRRGML